MKIPKSFCLLGLTYTVSILPDSEWPDGDAVGCFSPDTRHIRLRANRDRAALSHVFLHEATHAILNAMGRDRLYADEAFVDLFSGFLHQLLKQV